MKNIQKIKDIIDFEDLKEYGIIFNVGMLTQHQELVLIRFLEQKFRIETLIRTIRKYYGSTFDRIVKER